jgi:hypothetical protein
MKTKRAITLAGSLFIVLFLVADIVRVVLIFFIPALALWLASLMS